MKNENEKMQEVLANFSCEQLLFEVYRRNNIYVSGWWNSDHIQEYTGLPSQYHTAFIKYCNDKAVGGEVGEAFEQWLQSIKKELKSEVMCWFNTETQHLCGNLKMFDFIDDRLEICYEPVDGIYPFIDLSYKKEDGDAEEIQNIIFDLITVFEPYQGNLKTHIEEKMQELINDYFCTVF